MARVQNSTEQTQVRKTHYPEKHQVASNSRLRTQAIRVVVKTGYVYLYNQGDGVFKTWVAQAAKRNCDHLKALIVAKSFSWMFLIML